MAGYRVDGQTQGTLCIRAGHAGPSLGDWLSAQAL